MIINIDSTKWVQFKNSLMKWYLIRSIVVLSMPYWFGIAYLSTDGNSLLLSCQFNFKIYFLSKCDKKLKSFVVLYQTNNF